jgi:hypothetical protein
MPCQRATRKPDLAREIHFIPENPEVAKEFLGA